jgi:hypothetical protein
MDQSVGVRSGAAEGHRQRLDNETSVLVFVHCPADDAAMAQVADGGEVELAFTSGELGDIGDPAQVRSLGAEHSLQAIGGGGDVGSAAPPALACVGTDKAVLTHDPGDPPP